MPDRQSVVASKIVASKYVGKDPDFRSLEEAEQETLQMIQRNCERHIGILAGNSVWQDAAFMRIHMPRIMKYLHYRILDVSSIKEVIKCWYPKDPHLAFEKKSNHRALGDIQESIEELKHYREYFFKPIE